MFNNTIYVDFVAFVDDKDYQIFYNPQIYYTTREVHSTALQTTNTVCYTHWESMFPEIFYLFLIACTLIVCISLFYINLVGSTTKVLLKIFLHPAALATTQ